MAATHPVFTPEARKNLNHTSIREIIVTDSIPVTHHHWRRAYVVSLAPLLAEAIRRGPGDGVDRQLFRPVVHGRK